MRRIIFFLALSLAGNLRADSYAYVFTLTDQFGTMDLDTGAFFQLGTTGLLLSGLGVANGKIYGGAYNGNTLYQVNPEDGTLTSVGNGQISYYDTGSTTRGLYALDSSMNFYSVNPLTGAATLIGSTGLQRPDTAGMSANSDTLYVTLDGNVYTINTTTAVPTLVGSSGLSTGIGAMLYEGGELYAGSNSPFQVDTLDPSTGQATFLSNPSGNPAPANFWGLAPSVLLQISPQKLAFAPQTVGTTSEPQTVTLANHGFYPMKIRSITSSGDFAQTNTCSTQLLGRSTCTISITFTPLQSGPLTGSINISDSAGDGPQHAGLTGTGK